jgi:acyl-CoA thioester hydrolase
MFEYNFNARGYELDSYGHVNHAVYLNYFEQARWELFRQRDLVRYFKENELLLVVIEVQARYHREINLYDDMVIRTEIRNEPPYLVFNHKMYFTGSKVKACSATIKTLFRDKGKLVRDIPQEILEKLT